MRIRPLLCRFLIQMCICVYAFTHIPMKCVAHASMLYDCMYIYVHTDTHIY